MTTTARHPRAVAVARPPILTRALWVRFVSVVACAIGFYLPLSVVPLYAAQSHGGDASGAGLATVALLVATVAGELATPRLIHAVGYRWSLGIGLVLLGAPALALIRWHSSHAIIAISAVRGIGFAVAVVAGATVTATLLPAQRRGEGLAIVGLVGGIPSMVALPAGVWAAHRWGFPTVFVVTAVASLAALGSLPGLPARVAAASTDRAQEHHGVLAGLRNRDLVRPAAIFASSTTAVGVLVTFLPLALAGRSTGVVAAALLAQPTAATLTRWVAGRAGDRHGHQRLIAPGLFLSAIGIAAVAALGSPQLVVLGAIGFGAGFGLLQNATLSVMYAGAPAGAEGAVSAIWNAAYDLGMAAGALAGGVVAAQFGYTAMFLATAALMLPALVVTATHPRRS